MTRTGLVNAVFAQAIKLVACPTCDAQPGEACEDMNILHTARLDAYTKFVGGRVALRQLQGETS